MTNPTPDQIRLAREICARVAEEDGAEEYASKFRSGDIDRHPSLRSALAAIIEVTERAAGLADIIMGVDRPSVFGDALRNGEHLK